MNGPKSYDDGSKDPFYRDACQLVIERGFPSTSYVQRKLKLGYNRAWRMIEAMEREGIISHAGPQGKVVVGLNYLGSKQ